MIPWKRTDCEHYYEYYTWLSAHGLVLMPCCNLHEFNCVGCEKFEGRSD